MFARILDFFRRDYADPGTLLTEDDLAVWFDHRDLTPPGFVARSAQSIATCLDGLRGERERRLGDIHSNKIEGARLDAELAEIDQSIDAFATAAAKLSNVTPIRKGKAKEAAE